MSTSESFRSRVLGGLLFAAVGLGAGLLLGSDQGDERVVTPEPQVAQPSCENRDGDLKACLARLEATQGDLKVAQQDLAAKAAVVRSQQDERRPLVIDDRPKPDRRPPLPLSEKRLSPGTKPDRQRYVPYIPYREYRKYRFYKPYRSPKESKIGTEADCKENTFAQECIGTEVFCTYCSGSC